MAEPIDKDDYHNEEYIADMDLIGMMTKDELKNRISMALTDPILQQGYNLAKLESSNDNLVKMYNEMVESQNSLQQSLYKDLAELEKEIQDFKETNHELAELCIQRKKRIDELEKENAELKEKLAGAERTRDNLVQLGFPTFQSCREYANKINYAKEILQDYIRINLLPPIERNFDDEVELFKQAEQFLKED